MDYKLEMVQFPVTDIDRAKTFYLEQMGCSLVVDREVPEGKRVVQVLPPGSACAIGLGDSITDAASGVAQALLVVTDIQAARDELTVGALRCATCATATPTARGAKASIRRCRLHVGRRVQRPRRQPLVPSGARLPNPSCRLKQFVRTPSRPERSR
jgi:hypothetical protein